MTEEQRQQILNERRLKRQGMSAGISSQYSIPDINQAKNDVAEGGNVFGGDVYVAVPEDYKSEVKYVSNGGLLGNIKEDISSRKENIQEAVNRTMTGQQSGAETGFQIVGQVAGGIGDVIGNLFISGIKAITPDVIENAFGKAGKKFLKTNAGKSLANAGIKTVEAYQDWKEEHPRFAANLESALNIADLTIDLATMGGVKTIRETAKEGAEEVAEKVAKRTAPNLMEELVEEGGEKAVKKSTKIGDYVVSQVTGLNPETVRTIVNDPDAFKKISKELDRETLTKQIADVLDNRLEELSNLGAGYDVIRKSNKSVDVPVKEIDAVLKKHGLGSVDKKGIFRVAVNKESTQLKSGDVRELQEFLDTFINKNDKLSANAILNARQKLDQLAEWGTDKSSAAKNISKELRRVVDDTIADAIPEIKALDIQYGPEKRLLTQIKRDLLNADGTLKDNAMSKIANLTGEARKTMLARIKQIDPDIESKVNIVKAMEDIERAKGLKVGTYTRSAAAGAGLASGKIAGTITGFIMASPSVVVPLLEAYGKAKKILPAMINNVITQIKNNKLTKASQKIVRDMIDYMENALITAPGSVARKEIIRDITIPNINEAKNRSSMGENIFAPNN